MESSKPKKKPSSRISPERVSGNGKVSLRARLWFDMDGETFIAQGRATLLKRIEQYGSITKAAKSMEMSYRHAWLLVDDMNRKAPTPLVERVSGGKGGGGTKLTEEGGEILEKFEQLQLKVSAFMRTLEEENLLI